MGKLKRGKKNQKARYNPLTKKSSQNPSDAKKDETTRQSKILPLIQKLLSSSPNDRSMALGAITVLCEDTRMRKLLLKEKLVHIIMEQCLNDNNDELVVEAFGLLRNLGIDEGYDVLKFYWRSNIWASIQSSLDKIQKSFVYLKEEQPKKELSKKQKEDEKSKRQLLFDFTEHILSLIVVIASGSDDLFDNIFDRIGPVLQLVIDLINLQISTSKLSDKLYNTLLDFIYEFASESDEFIKTISESQISLEAIENYSNMDSQKSNIIAKSYIEGLKFHINEVMNLNTNKNEVATSILSSIFGNLSHIDLEKLKDSLRPKDNSNEPIQSSKNENIDQQISGSTEERDAAKVNLQTIEIAIDLTTSIFEYLAINDDPNLAPDLEPQTQDIIFNTVIPSVSELIRFNLANPDVLLLTDKFVICFNNLAWLFLSLESIPVEWFNKLLNLWDLVLEVSKSDDQHIQKDCLSFFWAVVKAVGPEIRTKVNYEMIGQLLAKCEGLIAETQNGEFIEEHLEYSLTITGFVGSLAPIIGNTEITQKISEFLLNAIEVLVGKEQTVSDPNAIEIVLESINLIFDIFADKGYDYNDAIYVQGNYSAILKRLEYPFKDMYKKIDKNRFGYLKLKGEETFINLGRFIEYKDNE